MKTLGKIPLAALALILGAAGQARAAPRYEIIQDWPGGPGTFLRTPRLALDPQGVLYSTSTAGGSGPSAGTVWSLTPPDRTHRSWTLSTLRQSLKRPMQGVARAPNGTLYVADDDGLKALAPAAGTLTTVAATGRDAPFALTPQGPLYGTTPDGGTSGKGALFSVAPPAPPAFLYSFGKTVPPGVAPAAPNRIDVDAGGTLYGTTGAASYPGTPATPDDGRVVFRRAPGQVGVTILAAVSPVYGYPLGVVPDGQGNLYGVTNSGAASAIDSAPEGWLYRLGPAGDLTALHEFSGAEGHHASAPPVLARDGNLYGALALGGQTGDDPEGCGVLYRLTPAGQYAVVHAFAGGDADGCRPFTGLVQDKAGWLYGTTYAGGATSVISNVGTIFRYHP